jgi:hypothetical protein
MAIQKALETLCYVHGWGSVAIESAQIHFETGGSVARQLLDPSSLYRVSRLRSALASEPRRNPIFLKCILRFRGPRKKIKAEPGGEAASPPACAIGAFIGLHCQKCI